MPTVRLMEIGDWLRSLDLEQYEAAFKANAVDAGLLRDLTDQDLQNEPLSAQGHGRPDRDHTARLCSSGDISAAESGGSGTHTVFLDAEEDQDGH